MALEMRRVPQHRLECGHSLHGRQKIVKIAWATFAAAVRLFTCGFVTRPDWIEATLMTVDVSGLWEGRSTSPGGAQRTAILELHQEWPKVTGTVSWVGFTRDGSGPLEGRVNGEVFHFTVRSAAGAWTGELTVGDDKMEGQITQIAGPAVRVLIRRVSRAP
jgi:hypothetical protein